jgi:HD-like signal output (HDOD) protein
VTFLYIAILVLLIGLVLIFRRKPAPPARPATPSPVTPPKPAAASLRAPPAAAQASTAVPMAARDVPPTLAALRVVGVDELDSERKLAIVAALRNVPRPPPALQKLISRDFVAKATSSELSQLVMAEPLISAKVLATVNSPFYGLQKPVANIGQAVTFLGFNTVRGIGLQYMLNDSFKASSAEVNRVFDGIWAASAMASELCAKLAQKLDLPEQGALVTHLVLSFVGQLATVSLLPAHAAVATAKLGLLGRVQQEQEHLGLASAEIGSLLMQEWTLPPSIVQDVHDIAAILVTPAAALDAQRGPRLALCYLCARLGERLALGTLSELSTFDPLTEPDPDFFHLQSYLAAPALARLMEHLHAPELQLAVAQMQEARRAA